MAVSFKLLRARSGLRTMSQAEAHKLALPGADLRGMRLVDVDLSGRDLQGIDLRGATLTRVSFRDANLRNAEFREAELEQVSMVGARLVGAKMQRLQAPGLDLSAADLSQATLQGAFLPEVSLSGAVLDGADLRQSRLEYCLGQGLSLRKADLRGAALDGARLQGADLSGADLSRASLHGADLRSTKLVATLLRGADLGAVLLQDAQLSGLALDGVSLPLHRLSESQRRSLGFAARPAETAQRSAPPRPVKGEKQSPTTQELRPGASLAGIDLQGRDLRKVDLSEANLSGAKLARADLRGANLDGALLAGADLSRARLEGASMRELRGARLSLEDARLERADMRGALLHGSNLRGARLSGARLAGAVMQGADLGDADLRGGDLAGVDLRSAVLRGADLAGASLAGAVMGISELEGAYNLHPSQIAALRRQASSNAEAEESAEGAVVRRLRAAGGAALALSLAGTRSLREQLTPGRLQDTELPAPLPARSGAAQRARPALEALRAGADLVGADLRGLRLSDVDLAGADLRGALLSGCRLQGGSLAGADLRGAWLQGAELSEVDLTSARLVAAHLGELRLLDCTLQGADLERCQAQGLRARGCEWTQARLLRADLRGADLRGERLSQVDLSGAQLDQAWLHGVLLESAQVRGADLGRPLGVQLADRQSLRERGARLDGALWDRYRAQLEAQRARRQEAARRHERQRLAMLEESKRRETAQRVQLAQEQAERAERAEQAQAELAAQEETQEAAQAELDSQALDAAQQQAERAARHAQEVQAGRADQQAQADRAALLAAEAERDRAALQESQEQAQAALEAALRQAAVEEQVALQGQASAESPRELDRDMEPPAGGAQPAEALGTRSSASKREEPPRVRGPSLLERLRALSAVVLSRTETGSLPDLLPGVDLAGRDLRDVALSGLDLRGADLRGARLDGVRMRGTVLAGALLQGAQLSGARLEGVDLREAVLEGASMNDASLLTVDLRGARAASLSLVGAHLESLKLSGADLSEADLSASTAVEVDFGEVELRAALFDQCDLSGAQLEHAHLQDTELAGALGLSAEQRQVLAGRGAQVGMARLPELGLPRVATAAALLLGLGVAGVLLSNLEGPSDAQLQAQAQDAQERGESQRALERWIELAQQATDPAQVYLYRMEQGALLERVGEPQQALEIYLLALESADSEAERGEALLSSARAHQALGQSEQAIASLQQALDLPTLSAPLTAGALLALEQLGAGQSEAWRDQQRGNSGRSLDVALSAARSLGAQGELRAALEWLSAVPSRDPEQLQRIAAMQGEVMAANGDLQGASQAFARALDGRPWRLQDGALRLEAASLWVQSGETERAAAALERLSIDAHPWVQARALLQLAELSEPQQAQAYLERVLSEHPDEREATRAAQLELARLLGADAQAALAERRLQEGDVDGACWLLLGQAAALPSGAEQAEALIERALSLGPGHSVREAAHLDLAGRRMLGGDVEGAIRALRAARSEAEASQIPELDARIAEALLEAGRLEDARFAFEGLVEHAEEGSEAASRGLLGLARVHESQGALGQARAGYQRVIQESADPQLQAQALSALAGNYMEQGEPALALEAWRRYLRSLPAGQQGAFDARFAVAQLLRERGQDQAAQSELLLAQPLTPTQHAWQQIALAELQESAQELEGAQERYATLLALPTLPQDEVETVEAGLARVERALSGEPEPEVEHRDDPLSVGLERADELSEQGDFQGALQVLASLQLQDRGAQAEVASRSGWMLAQSGDTRGAERAFEQLIQDFSGDAEAVFNAQLGLATLERDAGQSARALERLSELSAPDAGSAVVLKEQLAQTHLALDELESALSLFEQVADSPQDPVLASWSALRAGQVLAMQGHGPAARARLEGLVEHEDPELAQQAQQALSEL